MSYQNDIDSAIRSIDKKLDNVEELMFGLPVRLLRTKAATKMSMTRL